jgi:RNA polymerase sigma-70 factor (ECF subfamily)
MIAREQRRVELAPVPEAAAPEDGAPSPRPRGTRAHPSRMTRSQARPSQSIAVIQHQIELARAGDQQAMEVVIRHYQDWVARFIISIIGRGSEYEDLCQTAFVKIALGLPRLRSPEVFEAWMFRIARNVCMDHLRRLRWRRMFVPFTRDHEDIAAEEDDRSDRVRAFEAALTQLPPDQREIIGLLRDRDWSYEELAEITHSSVSAVGTRLFRARARLRKLMTQRES